MKKTLTILILIFSINCFSQARIEVCCGGSKWKNVIEYKNGTTIDSLDKTLKRGGKIALSASIAGQSVFNTFSDFKNVTSPYPQIVTLLGFYAVNDGGGGQFLWVDTSTKANNDGIIVKPDEIEGAGRYERLYEGPVNILWFGAQANSYFDNRHIILNAIEATKYTTTTNNNALNRGVVYIPGQSTFYYVSDSITITSNITITGDFGSYPAYPSRLLFAKNKPGFVLRNYPSTGSGSYMAKIQNLEINKDDPYHDTTSFDGIFSNTKTELDNVYVHNFPGNGISINTRYGGNANASRIINCHTAGNKISGLFMRGIESNNCYVESFHATGNGRFGVDDSSFLGNNYVGLQLESNGYRPGVTNVSCGSGNTYWWCIRDNVNVKPNVTSGWEAYWIGPYPTGAGNAHSNDWDSTKQYIAAGAFRSDGAVQKTVVLASYTEGDQGPIWLASKCMWIGGDAGSGFANVRMNYMTTDDNRWNLRGNGIDLDSSYQNDPNPSANWVSMDRTNGLTAKTKIGGVSFKGSWADKQSIFFPTSSPNIKLFGFTYPSFNPAYFGWPSGPVYAPIVGYRLAFREVSDPNRYRCLYLNKTKPTSGTYGDGDLIFNSNGDDSTILFWKKNLNGSLYPIKSSNYRIGKYTPTGTSDATGKIGDESYDDNYQYIKTSAGWKRRQLETF